MKIVVLGGSPKGEISVTMQYVKYMQKYLSEHNFTFIQAAALIKRLEKNQNDFSGIIDEIKKAEIVVWAFPLYYCIVCSGYKRFIELIFERESTSAFEGKYAVSLSTSINFYDHTAHNYIRSISEDLGMKYIGFFSANMNDIVSELGRKKLEAFSEFFTESAEKNVKVPRYSMPLPECKFSYNPTAETHRKISSDKKITLVTDSEEGNTGSMVERLEDCFSNDIKVVNLSKLNIKGGCMGCLKCSNNNICSYSGKDDYIEMFERYVKPADILILAGSIQDRYLSSTWQKFFERSFYNTHKPILDNKHIGIIISGPLKHIPDAVEILKGFFQVEGSHVIDIITDESHDSQHIDELIYGLATRLAICAELGYIRPPTFLGVAGLKIFRDFIGGGARVVFRADHKFYKKNKIYDFPQRNFFKNIFYTLGYFITGIPFVRKKMEERMREGMLMPYRRILEKVEKKV